MDAIQQRARNIERMAEEAIETAEAVRTTLNDIADGWKRLNRYLDGEQMWKCDVCDEWRFGDEMAADRTGAAQCHTDICHTCQDTAMKELI